MINLLIFNAQPTRRFLSVWIAFFIQVFSCSAQLHNANWCFGDSIGLNFKPNGDITFFKSGSRYTGSPESYSNPNGVLQIYTRAARFNFDSSAIMNNQHLKINNSNGIFLTKPSDNTNKILPINGNYYIFTLHGLTIDTVLFYFHEVDLSLNGGLGKMIIKNNLKLKDSIRICLETIKHANGKDWWILLHGNNNNKFYKYLLDQQGLTFHSYQNIGSVHGGYTVAGNLKASFSGNKIMMSSRNGTLDLFDFNRCTGEISNWKDVSLSLTQPGFNSSSNQGHTIINDSIIYCALADSLFQIVISGNNITKTCLYADTLMDNLWTFRDVAYQEVNNKVYVGYAKGSTGFFDTPENYYLGVVHNPQKKGITCNYIHKGLYCGRIASGYLPNEVNYGLGAWGTAYALPYKEKPTTICAGDTLQLGAGFTEKNVTYQWQPAAGLSCVSCSSPFASPAQTTTYTLITENNNPCGFAGDTATVTVTVLQPPVIQANAGKDTTICAGQNTTLGVVSQDTALTYLWSTGDTTAQISITPNQTTTYTLTVSAKTTFCLVPPAMDSVKVTISPVNQLIAQVGQDTAICAGESAQIGTLAQPELVYHWQPITGLSNPNAPQPFASPTQTTVYYLTVSKDGCFTPATDSVTVTILPKTEPPCFTAIEEITETPAFEIYPNPAKNYFIVRYNQPAIFTLENALGQTLFNQTLTGAGEIQITTDTFPVGVYLCSFQTETGSYSTKVVIER